MERQHPAPADSLRRMPLDLHHHHQPQPPVREGPKRPCPPARSRQEKRGPAHSARHHSLRTHRHLRRSVRLFLLSLLHEHLLYPKASRLRFPPSAPRAFSLSVPVAGRTGRSPVAQPVCRKSSSFADSFAVSLQRNLYCPGLPAPCERPRRTLPARFQAQLLPVNGNP